MSHPHWSEWIDDLVSGELPDDRRTELEEHLSSCEECRAELEALRLLRGATLGLAGRDDAPEGLEAAVRSTLDTEARAPAAPRFRVGPWLAAAAVLLVALAGWWGLRAPAADELPAAAVESFRLHQAGDLPHAIVTPEETVLEGFFAGQLDFRARVIDLRMMELTLVGGRVHELAGRKSALYAYRGPGDRVILCQMLPGTLEELPAPVEVHESRGFTFQVYERGNEVAVFWVEGEILCVLVSDLPAEELLALAREKAMA